MMNRILQTSEHSTVTAEVPGHTAIGCITGTGEVVRERRTGELISNEVALDVTIPLGTEDEKEVGTFQSEFAGL